MLESAIERPAAGRKTRALCFALLLLLATPGVQADCSDPCNYTRDYCFQWRLSMAFAFRTLCDTLADPSDLPFADVPSVYQGLAERYAKQQVHLLEMIQDPDEFDIINGCTEIPFTPLATCVEPGPIEGPVFDPDAEVFHPSTTQVVHFQPPWSHGIYALAGVDRVVAANGPNHAYIRSTARNCELRVENFTSERCVGAVMSDGGDGRLCIGPYGAPLSGAYPNFQGSSIWMIGGTLGISHLHSLVCILYANQSSTLAVHLPMDAIYTNYSLSFQDYFEAMTEAGMVNQFIDGFFLAEMRNPDVSGASVIFAEDSPYHLQVYLDGVLMRDLGDPLGRLLELRLTSHSLAGEDRFLAAPAPVTIGDPSLRPDWTYLWDDGTPGSLRTVNPQATETYVLTAVSPYGYVTSDAVTVHVAAPNLAVADLSWQPADPEPGDATTFTAELCNSGSQAASYTSFFFEVDGEIQWATYDPVSVPAGFCSTVSASTPWTAELGSHLVGAVGASSQDPPDDNRFEATLEVVDPPDLPDLVVSEALLTNPRLTPGVSETQVLFEVLNQACSDGSLAAEPSTLHFYLSASPFLPPPPGAQLGLTADVGLLPVGASEASTTGLSLPAGFSFGSYFLHLQADGPQALEECEEGNNFWASPLPLEVVPFCTLADIDGSGSVTVLDLVNLVNHITETVDTGNGHLDLVPSPPGFPPLVDMLDLIAALPCWNSASPPPEEPGAGGAPAFDFRLERASLKNYKVVVEVTGEVNTIEVLARLPEGLTFAVANGHDALGSGTVEVLTPDGAARLVANAHADLSVSSTALDGSYRVAVFRTAPVVDLSELTPVESAVFEEVGAKKGGFAVQVVFADGTSAVLYKLLPEDPSPPWGV